MHAQYIIIPNKVTALLFQVPSAVEQQPSWVEEPTSAGAGPPDLGAVWQAELDKPPCHQAESTPSGG